LAPVRRRFTAIFAGCFVGWHYLVKSKPADAASGTRTTGGPPPIPVTVARAKLTDFPVYLNGLGTVTAYSAPSPSQPRRRPDSSRCLFKQGRMVKEGDTLVEIDPRPYQAALDQALSKKAQDEANLKNARLNLDRSLSLAKKDYATQQQVDAQQAMVDQLTAQIQGDQAAIDNARPSSATRSSSLRCRDEPGSAWSIRATSCTTPIRTAS
jgi:multidrug efflux system membrane fusion protein